MNILAKVELFEVSLPVIGQGGVYFLFDAVELVYVGQAKEPLARLSEHRREGKQFDRVAFLAISDGAERSMAEAAYIRAYQPRYNRVLLLSPEQRRANNAASNKAWKKANPEYVKAKKRRWRKNWKARNPEKEREQKRKWARRRYWREKVAGQPTLL